MSDFGEICPIFQTGLYNELFIGEITASLYTTASMNMLDVQTEVAANAGSCLRLGRTVVVTNAWFRRAYDVVVDTAVLTLKIGRQIGSGTVTATFYATVAIGEDACAHPDLMDHWRQLTLSSSMTIHTADCLFASATGAGAFESGIWDFLFIYHEK